MTINQKILSIPPYISTSWKNVISLHMEERDGDLFLIIGLVNGSTIAIPKMDRTLLESVFAAHAKYMEQEAQAGLKEQQHPPFYAAPQNELPVLGLPLRIGIEGNMGNLLQHNPEAADSPDLPRDVLEKIHTLSQVVGFENSDNFPKPEPHCNCMHCQIMRVIQNGLDEAEAPLLEEEVEEVSPEDLQFRDWEIKHTGEELYTVTNPLNQEEHYGVSLGNPIGCTCGQHNCEHVRAVLNS